MVGDLGSLVNFRKELEDTAVLSKREASFIAKNCQFVALCYAVRIIRQTLSEVEVIGGVGVRNI